MHRSRPSANRHLRFLLRPVPVAASIRLPMGSMGKGTGIGLFVFFPVLCSFWISCPAHFPCYSIQGILELETAISTAFCNILVLELFMSHSILHLGFIWAVAKTPMIFVLFALLFRHFFCEAFAVWVFSFAAFTSLHGKLLTISCVFLSETHTSETWWNMYIYIYIWIFLYVFFFNGLCFAKVFENFSRTWF